MSPALPPHHSQSKFQTVCKLAGAPVCCACSRVLSEAMGSRGLDKWAHCQPLSHHASSIDSESAQSDGINRIIDQQTKTSTIHCAAVPYAFELGHTERCPPCACMLANDCSSNSVKQTWVQQCCYEHTHGEYNQRACVPCFCSVFRKTAAHCCQRTSVHA